MSTYQKRVCPACGETFSQSYTEYLDHINHCTHFRKPSVTVLVAQSNCVDRSQAESNSQFHRVAGSPEEATSELERIGSRQIATNANQETRKKNERSKYSYMTFLDNLDISPTLKAILYEEYLKREAYWKSLLRNKKTGEEKT